MVASLQLNINPLVDRVLALLGSWSNKFLSYAGRVLLIKSVFFVIQNYWSGIFLFFKCVLELTERKCRGFLWGGKADSSKALVA